MDMFKTRKLKPVYTVYTTLGISHLSHTFNGESIWRRMDVQSRRKRNVSNVYL